MFEITADDISLLSDQDLRTLVGLLCEAEARSRGFPASSVTWGGDQNAADGGIDVHVVLPVGTAIEGFVPRADTGYQVKKMDMPPTEILAEMRPHGVIRPSIQKLADQSGAYVVVSSEASTSDSALQRRLLAMAEAVSDLVNASELKLDFYDRTRLASWVRDRAGLVPWVRAKIGRAVPGWRAYGAWAYPPEGESAEYLLDERLRVQTGKKEVESGYQALDGIQKIRDLLREPRTMVRLVGLSGVGKTRFVQALFDDRVGERSLDPSLAIYTNLSDNPDPQPSGLASDLLAAGTRAILVIDNCPPELHRRLSGLCRSSESTISAITVEYDIREDDPEGTEVFALEPSSVDLIEALVKLRFPGVSAVDARTVAEFSGGNARVAMSLASTVGKNETVAGLTDEDLFRRLFQQRHEPDESLMLAAEACALVYSFQGEDVSDGDQAELVRLGSLIGKNPQDMFRHVAELQRRDLVQRRSVWRAVLPPAIANPLAATALQNIPTPTIEAYLVRGAPGRLMRSFSRRLGYLHDSKEAVAIVNGWLAPGGLLPNASDLNELGKAMFHNVAPTAPNAALSALEHAILEPLNDGSFKRCTAYIRLLRSLAYDAKLFERCVALIIKVAHSEDASDQSNEARDVFISLFPLHLSGTHATIEQRLHVLEPLLYSEDAIHRSLGLAGLKAALEAWHFGSHYNFEFGARSRDFGYRPRSLDEMKHWYRSTLELSNKLACSDGPSAPGVRTALAEKFRGLWSRAGMYDDLEQVCRAISKKQFWREGWIAVRQTLDFDSESFKPETKARLRSLEESLRPTDLVQKVRAIVVVRRSHDLDLDDFEDESTRNEENRYQRLELIAHKLGKAVASDEHAFSELLAELVGVDAGRLWSFGRGLAEGAGDANSMWGRMVSQLVNTNEEQRSPLLLSGFLSMLNTKNPVLVNHLLEDALQDDTLATFFPIMQAAVDFNEQGVDRLKRSVSLGKAPPWRYRYLPGTGSIPVRDFTELIQGIAAKPDGLGVAIDILYRRLHTDQAGTLGYTPELAQVGRELMRQLTFPAKNERDDYVLKAICEACLVGEEGAAVVQTICHRLKDAVSRHETYLRNHEGLLVGMFSMHPASALDGLFGSSDEPNLGTYGRLLSELRWLQRNPLDLVPEDEIIGWCDEEPETRYVAMASAITFSRPSEKGGAPEWTQTALRLLERAPDRVEVLRQYVMRFSPVGLSWGGSRATIVDANTKLLEDLEGHADRAVAEFAAQEKIRLAKAIQQLREAETITDGDRDERFE